MALTFVLDENIPGRVWRAIQRHNEGKEDTLDAVRVGQPDDLPFSCDDPMILLWAERHGRILITEDKSTMPAHLETHLGAVKGGNPISSRANTWSGTWVVGFEVDSGRT